MTPEPVTPRAPEPATLLPCPFCGGVPLLHVDSAEVECSNCCALVHGSNPKEAEVLWNLRSQFGGAAWDALGKERDEANAARFEAHCRLVELSAQLGGAAPRDTERLDWLEFNHPKRVMDYLLGDRQHFTTLRDAIDTHLPQSRRGT